MPQTYLSTHTHKRSKTQKNTKLIYQMSMKTNKSQSTEQRLAQCDQQYESRLNQHQTKPTIPSNLRVKCSDTN